MNSKIKVKASYMKRLDRSGFGAVQVILVFVILGMIGGTGWYVYNAQKNTNKLVESTETKQSQSTKSTTASTPAKVAAEEDAWLLFETKYYSVRVPDGWKLESQDDNMVGFTSNIVYVKGTKAYVDTSVEGGKDGPVPFVLYYPQQSHEQMFKEGDFEGNYPTITGLTVAKYKYVQQTDQEFIGYQKGDTAINYYFGKDGKYIQVTHYYPPGGTDQSQYVDRLVKTIQLK